MQEQPHIRLLGDFSLAFGDAPVVALNTPRLQSLLAYLLLHREVPQSRQHLAFLLWPDTTESQAQTNLRQLVHRLRAAVPQLNPYLLVGSRTLQWNGAAPFTLDVLEFERLLDQMNALRAEGLSHPTGAPGEGLSQYRLQRLSAAVELYIGDLLSGFYYEWIIPERERLRQRYIDALDALATGLANEGRYAEARFHAEKLKSADPLRESTYRTLMEVCSAMGDYSGAVRYYQECAATLDRELGAQPSPTTQATYRRILQSAATLAAQAPKEHQEVVSQAPNPAVVTPTKKEAPTNLPTSPNSFVGRQAEMAAVNALIGQDNVRLLTLLGAPGVGKTRLALQVALGMSRVPTDVGDGAKLRSAAMPAGSFPDGIYLVPRAPVSDPSLVASTIANALGVREEANRPIVETLAEWLGDKRLLLLLDNFEHLLGQHPEGARNSVDAAMVVSSLLSSCPHLKALVTSREALQLYGEHEFPVPPLELPSVEETATMEAHRLGEYSAVKLFRERAAAAQYGFTLNAENTATVAAICRRLEALPLAIELAATRVKLMPPNLLLQRLEQRLDELTGGARDVPARHRTLRAAIEWSYDLLERAEQQLFTRLAVFTGGSTLEAVEAICNFEFLISNSELRPDDVPTQNSKLRIQNSLDVLESLVSKSLVRQEEGSGGEARFGMLETIREYAGEQLQASGALEEIRQRHSSYFLALAERVESELHGPEQHLWLKHLEGEHDNLRAALSWSLQAGEINIMLRLTGALLMFWERRAYLVEGREWVEKALAMSAEPGPVGFPLGTDLRVHRAKALSGMGLLAHRQGDNIAARGFFTESLELYQETGDKRGIANPLNNLGLAIADQYDLLQARVYHERSLALRRELGDKWGIATSLHNLGITYNRQGEYEMARRLHEESLLLQRELGNLWGIGSALYMLADLTANHWADYTLADSYYIESLAIYRTLGSKWAIACVLNDQGALARYQQQYTLARSLYAESLLIFREIRGKQGIAFVYLGLGG